MLLKGTRRGVRHWWWLLLLVPLLLLGGVVAWASDVGRPTDVALSALTPDGEVNVRNEQWLVFAPVGSMPDTGLILYPGGKVDPRAYAAAAREIARAGYMVAIVPMPLSLAVLGPNRATEVIAAFPEVRSWAIGGHSLGGAMAARFAHRNPDVVEGLVLWAAYPPSGDDLSERDLKVVSIYGTLDGLATEAEIDASRSLLPPTTRWVSIEGGNHAQFGAYGPQSGDHPATMDASDQQEAIVTATVALLGELGR